MNKRTLQNAMFLELQEKVIFEKARSYAYQYLDEVLERPVFPEAEAIQHLQHFEEDLPGSTTEATGVIDLLHQYGAPATTAQVGGRYFGFVNGGAVPAGLAAKMLATFWDQNSAMQISSPIAAKLESVVEKWMRQLLNLPNRTVAGFVSGTSAANFCGLAAARFRLLERLGWDISEQGLFGAPRLRIVAGQDIHSAILKALNLLGFGKALIEWVPVDDQGRIIPERVPELDERTILLLQAGNVNTGSFDPFEELCERARRKNAWVHIDGAFGLWAAAAEQLKHLTKGMERANSWAVDGHKTLNTPYDSGIILCEDKNALASALHASGSYLVLDNERDGMFYTPEMSRRARIIELWATMKYLGRAGIDELVDGLHRRAVQFAKALKSMDGFTVLNEVVFNQVLVCCSTDELTEKVLQKIQELRICWVGGSSWQGRKAIRISVCSWATTEKDVACSARSFEQALDAVTNEDF